jgi:hypothetical protein
MEEVAPPVAPRPVSERAGHSPGGSEVDIADIEADDTAVAVAVDIGAAAGKLALPSGTASSLLLEHHTRYISGCRGP